MTVTSRLYFVALVPDEPLLSKVRAIKQEIAEHFGSKAALRSPAHITLHMPFQWREDREDRIAEALEEAASATGPFSIQLSGFNAFKPRVLYLDMLSSPPLRALHEAVSYTMRPGRNLRIDLLKQNLLYMTSACLSINKKFGKCTKDSLYPDK